MAWAKRVKVALSRCSGGLSGESSAGRMVARAVICDGEDRTAAEMDAGFGDGGGIEGVGVEGGRRRVSQVWRSAWSLEDLLLVDALKGWEGRKIGYLPGNLLFEVLDFRKIRSVFGIWFRRLGGRSRISLSISISTKRH